MHIIRKLTTLCLGLAVIAVACGGDGSGTTPTNTGQACTSADQCYSAVDTAAIMGTPICLDKVEGGYCTHSCRADSDCCAVAGECPSGMPEVCAPFESTGQMDCFLSCEDADLKRAGYTDSAAYCAHFATAAFICRSTGGGSNNRKVCVPN